MNHLIVFRRWLGDTDDLDYLAKGAAIKMTYQIERQRAGGSWSLHCDGKRFKDRDAAWQLVHEFMAWRPEMRLRLHAFRVDPYESNTKYLYPKKR